MSNTESAQVEEEMDIRIKKYHSMSHKNYFENIDISKFRKGINAREAIQIILWAIEGYGRELEEQLRGVSVTQIEKQYDKFLAEYEAFHHGFKKMPL
jgi:TetR/AcrR family transcriptional regulator